jgi:uncharacterized repeat protein (TIGR01451 family)
MRLLLRVAYLLLLFILFANKSNSQLNFWTWMHGDSVYNMPGNYGMQDTASPLNTPGDRSQAATWTDSMGNLYLFGGRRTGGIDQSYVANDLWRYNTQTNEWTWLNGDTSLAAYYTTYGTKGVAAASNQLSARNGSASWTDAAGNLWLFGGNGGAASTYGNLNDLWKYTPATNQWTWIKGDSTAERKGVYGIKGTTASANNPGGRRQSITWTDSQGNLWLFGGYGYGASTVLDHLNDLWKYNIATNQWTWMKGDNIAKPKGVFGTRGIAATANTPCGKYAAAAWTDASGDVWLFGGNGYTNFNTGYMNDLWKYHSASNEWTWVGGDTTLNGKPTFGSKGIAVSSNQPGARMSFYSWLDSTGNFWLFGGQGLAIPNGGYLNDLWKYVPSNNQWVWMDGSTAIYPAANHGTLGIPAATNNPGGRANGASWSDKSGKLWLYGGEISPYGGGSFSYMGDLWQLTPPESYNSINFYAFLDTNRNGLKDIGEVYYRNASANITKQGGGSFYLASSTGKYSALVDTGKFVTTVNSSFPYYNIVPVSRSSSFAAYFMRDDFSFALQPIAGKRDAFVTIIPINVARPGFPVTYKVLYKNVGTDTIASGVVELVKSPRLNVIAAVPAVTSITGDTLRWNISNLKPLQGGSISIKFAVPIPPVVNLGDTLVSVASITTDKTDLTPADNTSLLSQVVQGSFDPNDKTEKHGGKLRAAQVANREYLQYTIRFQNTGTDTAFNIAIRDTLDSKLDFNTLTMVDASHDYQLQVNDGKAEWKFDNINLVDSVKNEVLSHGYISYMIKAKSTVTAGNVITNSAAIYFDHNLPVITNIEKTTVVNEALPIKLLNFTATRNNNSNLLQWSTSNETSFSHFEIERSTNGREFIWIGNVTGGTNTYRFADDKFGNNLNYYRLKMIDKDGRYLYSPVRLLNNRSGIEVSLYPNPAKETLQLRFDREQAKTMQVQVLTLDGKVVITKRLDLLPGSKSESINIKTLQACSYFVKVINAEHEVAMLRFQKQ